MSEWLKVRVVNNENLEVSDGRKCGTSGLKIGEVVDVQIIDENHPKHHIYLQTTRPGEILYCKQTNNYILDKHVVFINKILYEGVEL